MTLSLPEIQQRRRQIRAELCRRSLARFIRELWSEIESGPLSWNWHIDFIAESLEAVQRGEIRRLLINIPPGCMKSLSVSSMYPAWDWASEPGRKFIASTYSQALSNKNARLHLDLVKSATYQAMFPHVKIAKDGVGEFTNTKGGMRFSTGNTGTITGFHGNVLIWDDLVNAKDALGKAAVNQEALEKANDFLTKVLSTRQANPKTTAIIGIMQRLHYADPSQRCIDSGEYTVISLPMEYEPKRHWEVTLPSGKRMEDPRTEEGELLWPDRFDQKAVDDLKKDLQNEAEAQLNQNPTPLEGNIFKAAHMEKTFPEGMFKRAKLITVDCTFKKAANSDYVVIQAWGQKGPNFFLLDQTRAKMDILETCQAIRRMQAQWRARSIRIEDKANGPAVVQILGKTLSGVSEWSPGRSSKEERAASVSYLWRSGNVYLPEQASWLADFKDELKKFPLGVHDDQVDAMTMALLILHDRNTEKLAKAYRKIR